MTKVWVEYEDGLSEVEIQFNCNCFLTLNIKLQGIKHELYARWHDLVGMNFRTVVNGLQVDGSGLITGHADPRRGGIVDGF